MLYISFQNNVYLILFNGLIVKKKYFIKNLREITLMIFLISDTFKEPPLALDNLYTFGPEMMPHFPILSHDANQPQWTTIVSANELQLYPNEKKKNFTYYVGKWLFCFSSDVKYVTSTNRTRNMIVVYIYINM